MEAGGWVSQFHIFIPFLIEQPRRYLGRYDISGYFRIFLIFSNISYLHPLFLIEQILGQIWYFRGISSFLIVLLHSLLAAKWARGAFQVYIIIFIGIIVFVRIMSIVLLWRHLNYVIFIWIMLYLFKLCYIYLNYVIFIQIMLYLFKLCYIYFNYVIFI